MKRQRKRVFHSIKSKYPSLRKNQECKEAKNRMVQRQQEGLQCYLITIISTFQNWTQGKRQGIEPGYEMKFGITWSTSPRACDRCCMSGSPGTTTGTAIMTINSGWKSRGYRGHAASIVTAFHSCWKNSKKIRDTYRPSSKDKSTAPYENVRHIKYILETTQFLFQDTQCSKKFISKLNGCFISNVWLHQTQWNCSIWPGWR